MIRRAWTVLLFGSTFLCAQSRFPFTASSSSEVVAEIDMTSPGADWAVFGREAAVADLELDGTVHQQIILYAGTTRHGYRVSLGRLSPGRHQLVVRRNDRYSAPEARLETHAARFEEIGENHPDFAVYASSPVLFARVNTIGTFSDIPLLVYCERLTENGAAILQYTVIFSNEDGGTSTRTLMGRWGRTTDIEYVYKRFVATGQSTIQGPGHKEVEFEGQQDGRHPLLMPVTDNNMVAAATNSPLRFRLSPVVADLTKYSREHVMDLNPVTYTVMAKELIREKKLREWNTREGEKISDLRNYLFVDYSAALTDAALTVSVRTADHSVYTSDLGRGDIAISRTGHVRTTVELPPGTGPEQIASLAFECRVSPASSREAPAHSGTCILQRVSEVFQLGPDYKPRPSLWSTSQEATLPTGRGIAFDLRR